MKCLLLIATVIASPAIARQIDGDELKDRHNIDRLRPTLVIFPEPAHLALRSPLVDLKAMMEGDGSKIWQITPRCKKRCKHSEVDMEFVLLSGRQIPLRLKIVSGVKDHVIALNEAPSYGSLPGTRHRLLPEARQTFLRAVRGWPKLPRHQEEIAKELKQLAEGWESYCTDKFTIHMGMTTHAKKRDVEALQDRSIILVGFFDQSIVVIKRRKA